MKSPVFTIHLDRERTPTCTLSETLEEFTMRQVVTNTGLSRDTLRYYERIGLLPPVRRNASGHRRYSRADLNWIEQLMRLRQAEMPIRQIETFAALQRQGAISTGQQYALLEAHRQALTARCKELARCLIVLKQMLPRYANPETSSTERVQQGA